MTGLINKVWNFTDSLDTLCTTRYCLVGLVVADEAVLAFQGSKPRTMLSGSLGTLTTIF